MIQFPDESIREVIRSPAVQALISDKIDEVFSTPEGLVLGLVVSKDKVKQNIMPSIENAGKDIVPLVSQLIRNSEVTLAGFMIISVDSWPHLHKEIFARALIKTFVYYECRLSNGRVSYAKNCDI